MPWMPSRAGPLSSFSLTPLASGSGRLRPTGSNQLPAEPWLSGGGLVPRALFRDRLPIFVADLTRSARGVAEYLEHTVRSSGTALTYGRPHGRAGRRMRRRARRRAAAGPSCRLAMRSRLALDRTNAARDADLQRELRALLARFLSRRFACVSTWRAGLEALCVGGQPAVRRRPHIRVAARSARARAESDGFIRLIALAEPRQVPTADAIAPVGRCPAPGTRRDHSGPRHAEQRG